MFLEDPVFPQCPSFGFTSDPMYSVTPIERASGVETRNRNWSRPLLRITATVGPRAEEDIEELIVWWHALGGIAYGFRFHDGTDYKSCRGSQIATATDCPVVLTLDGYQLVKRYTVGVLSQDRDIFKPIAGTILVADGGVPKVEGVNYTIDYATGLITFLTPPLGVVTWGGEFDVPVRFDSNFPVEIQDKRIESVSFVLRELRGE